mmetsp:Transcript_13923/g.23562  ORF Transcript_13923/g.23562 Transcript_13923/m.23562 type:complete len:222 (-) Transcript_13923:242-907(-)
MRRLSISMPFSPFKGLRRKPSAEPTQDGNAIPEGECTPECLKKESAQEVMRQSFERALHEQKAAVEQLEKQQKRIDEEITDVWRALKLVLVLVLLVLPLGPASNFAAALLGALALYDEVRGQPWTFRRVLQYQVLIALVGVGLHLALYLAVGSVAFFRVALPASMVKYGSHVPIDFNLAKVQTTIYMKMARDASSLEDTWILFVASLCFALIVVVSYKLKC